MPEKQCTKCKQTKLVSEFHKRNDTKDGYRSWCKVCRSTIEHPKTEAAYKGRRKEINDKWNAQNKDRKHQWYLDHKDELNERGRHWHHANKDRVHAAYRRRYEADPEPYKMRSRRRQAMIAGSEINDFSATDWRDLLEYYDHRCAYCGASGKMEKEHMQPLSRGGTHTKNNIVPACVPCNKSKRTKTVAEFLELCVETGPGA